MDQRMPNAGSLARRLTPPVLVFVSLMALFTFLWTQARRHGEAVVRAQTSIAADQAAARLEEGLRVRLELADQIRREWRISPFVTRADFERRAQGVEAKFAGYQAINWIDPDGIIRWVVPEQPNAAALGADLHRHPWAARTFERAEGTGETMMTEAIPLLQGGLGVAVYLPITVGERRLGYVNAVFRLDTLVRECLKGTLLEAYDVAVDDGGRVIYSDLPGAQVPATEGGAGPLEDTDWESGELRVLGHYWRVRLQPARHIETGGATLRPMLVAAGLIVAFGAAALTFLALERRRQALQSQEQYRQLFEDSMDVVYISSREGRMLDVNPAGVKTFGATSREQLLEMDIGRDLFLQADDREELVRHLERDGYVHDYAVALRRLDGRELLARISTTVVRDAKGRAVAFRGILRDETETVRMLEKLASIERMQSLSQLAGGIAHDFNNILAGILGHASLLRARLADTELRRHVDAVEAGVDAANGLTNQLLAFARGDLQRREPVDVNELALATLSLIGRTLPEGTRVETALDSELPTVDGDEGQLRQVLLNLVVNARDAVGERGVISVSSSTVEDLPFEALPPSDHVVEGRFVRISVSDTGAGIAPDVKARIFEPFFSTKPRGQGTGLGLAVVFGVVTGHGGFVHVETGIERGTCISVYLPVGKLPDRESPSGASAVRRRVGERILVVDDDDIVRSLLVEILFSEGYSVVEARDGVEAVDHFSKHHDTIDLVILDLTMPRRSGRETFEAMRSIDPHVRVLISSGFGKSGEGETLIRRGAVGFLQKPYRAGHLVDAVRRALVVGITS